MFRRLRTPLGIRLGYNTLLIGGPNLDHHQIWRPYVLGKDEGIGQLMVSRIPLARNYIAAAFPAVRPESRAVQAEGKQSYEAYEFRMDAADNVQQLDV
jgi:hypothetical protein